jgi:hypothetical protein
VYRDPGDLGDDRVYVLRRGVVRAAFPYPATPIEHEAFRAVVAEETRQPPPPSGPLPLESIDEVLLMMAWFRAHPDALKRTTPYESVDVREGGSGGSGVAKHFVGQGGRFWSSDSGCLGARPVEAGPSRGVLGYPFLQFVNPVHQE